MSTGGGDNIEVGGISASIDLDTGALAADLKKAEAALKDTGDQIKELQAYIQATGGKVGQFDATLKELTNTERQQQQEVKRLSAELSNLGVATEKVGGSMRSTRMAMHSTLMVGSDLATGSVQGLTSHLERLGYGMSAVAGLSPVMGAAIGAGFFVAAAGIKAVVEHWDEFLAILDIHATHTEAEEMEKLEKATSRTADEQARLNKYKREQHEIAEIMAGRSKAEQGTAGSIGGSFSEGDPEAIVKGIVSTRQAQGKNIKIDQGEIDRIFEEQTDFWHGFGLFVNQAEENDKLEKKFIEEAERQERDRAQELMRSAKNDKGPVGDAARKELANIVKSNPGAFPEGLAGQVRAGGPDQMRETADANQQAIWERKGRENVRKYEKDAFSETMAGASEGGWDPKTMKGRAGLRSEARQRVGEAEEDLPGTGKMAEARTATWMARGASPDQAAKLVGEQVAQALEAAGMTKDEAKAAGADVAKKAGHDVQEKIVKKALDDKGEAAKASETFKIEDLQSRAQGGIGGEKAKPMSIEEASIDALAKKFKDNGIRFMVKK